MNKICEQCYEPFQDTYERYYNFKTDSTAQFCSPECYGQFLKDRAAEAKLERQLKKLL